MSSVTFGEAQQDTGNTKHEEEEEEEEKALVYRSAFGVSSSGWVCSSPGSRE